MMPLSVIALSATKGGNSLLGQIRPGHCLSIVRNANPDGLRPEEPRIQIKFFSLGLWSRPPLFQWMNYATILGFLIYKHAGYVWGLDALASRFPAFRDGEALHPLIA